MTDLFNPALTAEEIHKLSTLSLAHVGDSVYELIVRTNLAQSGIATSASMHRETVKRVSATAQASVADTLIHSLTDEERRIFMRGRNSKPGSFAKSAGREAYQKSTALEALIGWLYLTGRHDRLIELQQLIAAEGVTE